MKALQHVCVRICLTGSAVTSILLTMPAPALAADPVAECIGANERSLDLRKQGRLIDARRELATCAVAACPELIQQACSRRIGEVNTAMPSVVFDVRDGAGRPLGGARVSIDGKPASAIGVTAMAIDPGVHALRIDVDGQPSVSKSVSFLEGEKEKRVAVVVGAPAPLPPDEARFARLVVSSDEGATVVVDGQAAARGRFEGQVSVGPHDVDVTEPGKVPYKAQLELRDGEMRSLTVVLEDERHGGALWPWIAGGVVVAAGAVVGGYFLFKPQDQTVGIPAGKTASLQLSLSGR